MVVGEARAFLTALVVPDETASYNADDLRTALLTVLRDYNAGAAGHEKVRDLRVVDEAFTVENGRLTPTMKLKRRAIESAYAGLVEEMYQG